MDTKLKDETMNVPQVAEYLKMSESNVYKLIQAKKDLPFQDLT